jgi:hypothetical protein
MVNNCSLKKKMNNHVLCAIFVILPLLFGVYTSNGQTAIQSSTTANVTATVVTDISSVKTTKSGMGHFYPGSFNGKLVNRPDGILSLKGNIDHGSDVHYSSSFDVSGNANFAFNISVPRSPVTLTNKLGSKTITINDWKYVSMNTLVQEDLPIGYKRVNLNATLKLGSLTENPSGYYIGYYTVTFGFN